MKTKIVSILCLLAVLLSASTSVVAAAEAEKSVQGIVYDFLINELELCPAAAAGIMGNVMIECGFDPDLEVIDTNDKPSYGLMMWNGPRYEALKKWCTEHGYKKSDPEGQLSYLKWELENTEKAAYKSMKAIPNTIEGACRAAILWASDFERCTRTSYGLRIYYALNNYWQKYAGGSTSATPGIYGYYYNVPDNIKYGEALTLYGAVVSYSSPLKSITAGVYTTDGELVTGKTVSASNLAGNIGVIDRYVVFNKIPKGSYYYTITAVNAAGEYMVERHSFTVSDKATSQTLVPESEGGVICDLGASCPALVFKDMLPASHWAHDAVDFVLSNGFFEGNGKGYFLPKTNMSRAMAVTVLHRIANSYGLELESGGGSLETFVPITTVSLSENPDIQCDSTPSASESPLQDDTTVPAEEPSVLSGGSLESFVPTTGSTSAVDTTKPDMTPSDTFDSSSSEDEPTPLEFIDIKQGSWYEEHALWAVSSGIIEGKGDGIFDPDGELSRGELAVMLYRFAARCGLDVTSSADLSSFADSGKLPRWAQDGMVWAVSNGLINGTKRDGAVYLDHASKATREQVATIMLRFAELIQE